jgi:uncharacterized membrane protein
MPTPFHPLIVHFPLALTFVVPILVVIFAIMIRMNKMNPKSWLIIVGLQMVIVGTGYIALESGETEEDQVEKVVSKSLIHEHEEAAEVFVGSAVVALVLSIAAFFVRKEIGFPLKIVISLIGLVSCYLSYRTGHLGGELVYKHGAASVYVQENSQALIPAPGKRVESILPMEENESLKTDENDYGQSDNSSDSEDDDLKEED